MHDITGHYINATWVPSIGAEHTDLRDPRTDAIVGRAPSGAREDVDAAVAAAVAAFPAWATVPRKERQELMSNLERLVRDNQARLAETIEVELGSPSEFAHDEHVGTPLAIIADYATILADEEPEERIGNSIIVREPVGVVAAILPWNYPLYQLVAKVVPALAAGCTVVAKPAELTPLSTSIFAELLTEAGFPAGVFNVVYGSGSVVGQAMSEHPDVDMVSFTGSTSAGRTVSRAAASTIKRVALELGGKSASVVLPGADLTAAVPASVAYCFTNTGQCCNAWTRLVVPRQDLAEVERLATRAAAELEPTLGPLVSAKQATEVQRYIEIGISEGARLVAGGTGRPEGRTQGHYVRGVVFSDVSSTMTIAQEEIFGPVLAILPYDTVEEAVAIANDSVFGLHGGVWAETEEEAMEVALRIRTGQVDINGAAFNPSAPFGGFKQSGNGRELGVHGLDEFFELKAIQV